jgi:hypothetical protein
MKNALTDLNNYLFEQLERLNDDSLSAEELDREMKKADAIVKVSDKIIQTGELALRTIKHRDEYGYNSKTNQMPDILQLEAK